MPKPKPAPLRERDITRQIAREYYKEFDQLIESDVIIVGAGPSGFYAADGLLRARPDLHIDIIDRLPTPYGLVRAGVAPDHQGTKAIVRQFEKLLTQPDVRFAGNIEGAIGQRIGNDGGNGGGLLAECDAERSGRSVVGLEHDAIVVIGRKRLRHDAPVGA